MELGFHQIQRTDLRRVTECRYEGSRVDDQGQDCKELWKEEVCFALPQLVSGREILPMSF